MLTIISYLPLCFLFCEKPLYLLPVFFLKLVSVFLHGCSDQGCNHLKVLTQTDWELISKIIHMILASVDLFLGMFITVCGILLSLVSDPKDGIAIFYSLISDVNTISCDANQSCIWEGQHKGVNTRWQWKVWGHPGGYLPYFVIFTCCWYLSVFSVYLGLSFDE